MFINNQPIFVAEPQNPHSLLDWRECRHSLTDKLQAARGSTQLTVISQQWTRPTWWDRYLLQIDDELIFEREIMMKHHHTDYWYARTIIPKKCYFSDPEFFKRLEKESIRNLIFDNSKVHRVTMLNYPIDKQCIEFNWVKKHLNNIDGIIWVRLAEYSLNYLESFYLAELLLPELECLSC
ncbi:chorismate--pyruvate lyase family protein [Legionella fallonii]|uniref:4-hydroxybenzoate synthetase n=1 Tax=Legionella fallonii LLAP-10 TaxID=1212491 RepID=A0A098G2W3_9GAMM|nr:chorismate lyase [Legionella fallonii]CEG56798.1 4-hydroxybenzoate synthetase [Legionella fallonii LLAP-10]